MHKALIWCVIILFIPIGIMVVYTLWQRLTDYLFKPSAYNNYWKNQPKETQTIFCRTSNKRKIIGRKHPPCATFFSKMNGEERQVDGSYEEKWLTPAERWNWKMRKER